MIYCGERVKVFRMETNFLNFTVNPKKKKLQSPHNRHE